MTSVLKVDTIQDQSGNNIINESGDTITIGASGDTITIPSGATFNTGSATVTYPAGSISNEDISSTAAIATTKLGAGAVLQVVQSNVTGTINVAYFSTVANGLVNTGLSASITPSSSSNKILIIISPVILIEGVVQPTDVGSGFGIKRNATNIYSTSNIAILDSTNYGGGVPNIVYLDSPSTTSSTTYELQVSRYSNNGGTRVYLNRNFQGVDISTITLIEVKG